MRSMLIIGLGRFGSHLAKQLTANKNEVLAVDIDEGAVNAVAPDVTEAQIADCADEAVLEGLGPSNFDICFVCIGGDFSVNLEITLLLKELGAKKVVCKTDSDRHARLLLKTGADEIIYPERDVAARAAVRYSGRHAFDYFALTPEYAVYEIGMPDAWIGKSVGELAIRSRHNLNVIGVKQENRVIPVTNPNTVFENGEHVFVAGSVTDIQKLLSKI